MIRRSRSLLSVRADAGDRVGLAGHAPGLDDLGMPPECLGDLLEQGAGGVEQLDQGLGAVAEGGVIDDGGEPPQRAAGAKLVDAALDRGRGQRHPAGDVVVAAPPVFDEKRKNLSV